MYGKIISDFFVSISFVVVSSFLGSNTQEADLGPNRLERY